MKEGKSEWQTRDDAEVEFAEVVVGRDLYEFVENRARPEWTDWNIVVDFQYIEVFVGESFPV